MSLSKASTTRKFLSRIPCSTILSQICKHQYTYESHPRTNAFPEKRIIFSAIQPTGIPHLGNYLGAMKSWVILQKAEHLDTHLIFSVADLHALTVQTEPELLRRARMQALASMLAIGLDEDRCTIFMQSDFGIVTELMWILSCTSSIGYLSRMTQWKNKTQVKILSASEKTLNTTKSKLGLFSYPVLQAADILIHKATHVPVGADQAQHLEFARECVTNFNSIFSPILVKPETLVSPSARVMSLANPSEKMSKSSGTENSRILITDNHAEIRKKIMNAVTDHQNRVSWDPETRPGVANLLSIFSAFDKLGRTPQQLADDMCDLSLGDLKKLLIPKLNEGLQPIRERYNELMARQDYLSKVAIQGLDKAYSTGLPNLKLIRQAVGLN